MKEVMQKFRDWVESSNLRFKERGLVYEVSESPTDIDKTSIRVDFESPSFLSRITLWDTGECYLEAIKIETEETAISNYLSVHGEDDFDVLFQGFIEEIAS